MSAPSPHKPTDLRGLTVLLVDHDAGADALAMFLRSCGADVLMANTAHAGLDYIDGATRISAVVTGVLMPGASGVDFLRTIRTHGLPSHRDGWVYEEKVDGWRMLAYKDGRRVRLISRNAVDHTWRFPELSAAIANLKTEAAVLDGEVAVFDEKLVSRFHLLNDDSSGVLSTPPVFIAFDVLQVGGRDFRSQPLIERRRVLEDVIDDVDFVLPCRRLPEDGTKAWDIVVERGYEGLVAKDPRSTYRAGQSRAWMKVKVRHEAVFRVGGIRDADAFDGVLVGEQIDDRLHYRGVVEWGFRAVDVLELMRATRVFRTSTSPFCDLRSMRGALWLDPYLRAEVSYAELVHGRLRAPSWRRLIHC